jgi:hypothetical protein
MPAHRLVLPADTFTVTVLRDPVNRLVSLYRYLKWIRDDASAPATEPAYGPNLIAETEWLGTSFGEFLSRVPRRHLLPQLFMFSERFDVDEATERIRRCDSVCYTESFAEDVGRLAGTLGLSLEIRHERKFGSPVELSPAEADRAKELLAPEHALLELVRNTDQIR